MTTLFRKSDNTTDTFRPNAQNPRFSACATHLRRYCGVCVHFDAAIIRTTARCNLLGGVRSGLTNAWDCQDWARKSAGGVK